MPSAHYVRGNLSREGIQKLYLRVGDRVGIGVSEDGFNFRPYAKGIVSIDPEYETYGELPHLALSREGASSPITGDRTPIPLPYLIPALDVALENLTTHAENGKPKKWEEMNIINDLSEGDEPFFAGVRMELHKALSV